MEPVLISSDNFENNIGLIYSKINQFKAILPPLKNYMVKF